MSDELGPFRSSEGNEAYDTMYRRIQARQFLASELRRLDEDMLSYISGHRFYDYPRPTGVAEPEALGIQQKVRGNALRAKDELDRRTTDTQMRALRVSNWAVVVTAIAALGSVTVTWWASRTDDVQYDRPLPVELVTTTTV